MKKRLLVLLLGLALLAFALVLTGCTDDSNCGGCRCRAEAGIPVRPVVPAA